MKLGGDEKDVGENVEANQTSPGLSTRERLRRKGKGCEYLRCGAWNVRTMLYNVKLKKGVLNVSGGGLGKEEDLCHEFERKKQNQK